MSGDGRESRGAQGGFEPTLPYLVKQVELAVRAHLDAAVRPAGLTPLQYTAMTVLERHPGLTSARLARNSFVTAQSMADIINALLTRGLIERHRDPDDRRRLVLSLTPAGTELLDTYREPVAQLESRMLQGMSDARARALRESLLQCRTNLMTDVDGSTDLDGARDTARRGA